MSAAAAEMVIIGRVIRPQGRKGELLAEPLSDRPERFASLERVLIASAAGGTSEMTVTHCWPHKGRVVLKLQGLDSIEAAERLRGCSLGIAIEELPALPQGCYYHYQLRGLRVLDTAGRVLGCVSGVLETGAVPVLEIAGAGGELLLPLAEPFIAAVDLVGGSLTAIVPVAEEAAAR